MRNRCRRQDLVADRGGAARGQSWLGSGSWFGRRRLGSASRLVDLPEQLVRRAPGARPTCRRRTRGPGRAAAAGAGRSGGGGTAVARCSALAVAFRCLLRSDRRVEDARQLQVGRDLDAGDRDEPDARVVDLARQHHADLGADLIGDAVGAVALGHRRDSGPGSGLDQASALALPASRQELDLRPGDGAGLERARSRRRRRPAPARRAPAPC